MFQEPECFFTIYEQLLDVKRQKVYFPDTSSKQHNDEIPSQIISMHEVAQNLSLEIFGIHFDELVILH